MTAAPLKILILEDDPDLREMLGDVLEEQGYLVKMASRGEEAVEMAASEAFDLFLADVRMEGMGGLKAIEAARHHQPDLGSLVVSGWASEEQTLEAVRLQVGGYLKKPFAMTELLQRVNELLAQRGEQKKREEEKAVLRASALWALRALARVADRSALLAPRGALARVEAVAAQLAQASHLPGTVVEQIQVGASVAGLAELSTLPPPREVKDSEALNALFSLLECHADARPEAPLPAQIAGLAIAAALRDPEEGLPQADEIERRYPGRFPPELLAAYSSFQNPGYSPEEGASVEVLAGLQDPARLQRSLLSLAQAMEASGDLTSAGGAYKKLLEGEPTSAQATGARLGLARLLLRQGQSEEATGWALEAPRRAKPLGPAAFGQAALGCGLLLQEAGHPQAEASLKAAATHLERVGLHASAAVAWLALGTPERQTSSLETLAQPAHWGEVSRAADWLLPRLLEGWTPDPSWAAAERLLLAFSEPLARLQGGLSQRARESLLRVLERHKDRASTALLESLASGGGPEWKARINALKPNAEGMPFLRLRSLGFFEVYLGERKVDEGQWRTQKTKYLLAYLAGHPKQAILGDRLIDHFWPETRAKAEQNLWAATSAIRRVIKPGNFILREGDTLSLNPQAPYWHDYEELDKLLSSLSKLQPEAEPEPFAAQCQRVAQLYTGPYLDGCYMEWAVRRRGQLEEMVSRVLTEGAHALLRLKRYPEALEMAERSLDVDSLRADAHLMKMRAYLGLGQPEATVVAFEACERMLSHEFDLEPSTTMLEILMRARNGLPDPGN